MIRLNMVVEGETERKFLMDILSPYLNDYSITVHSRIVRTGSDSRIGRVFKGGSVTFESLCRDIRSWIAKDKSKEAYFSTMLDYYGQLPGFYHRLKSPRENALARVMELESHLDREIGYWKFIPYFNLHEFEALLLSDSNEFKTVFPDQGTAIEGLRKEIDGLGGKPEEINDEPASSPAKRIAAYLPEYLFRKQEVAVSVAGAIGIDGIRRRCPHFDAWIQRLIKLGR